jgi:hypothetical protein
MTELKECFTSWGVIYYKIGLAQWILEKLNYHAFRIDESNIPNIAKKVKEYCDCISKEMGNSNYTGEYTKL